MSITGELVFGARYPSKNSLLKKKTKDFEMKRKCPDSEILCWEKKLEELNDSLPPKQKSLYDWETSTTVFTISDFSWLLKTLPFTLPKDKVENSKAINRLIRIILPNIFFKITGKYFQINRRDDFFELG